MNILDKIITENINRFIIREGFYPLDYREKMKYKPEGRRKRKWIRIGEVLKKDWSNKLMGYEYTKFYFEVNNNKTQALEELKSSSVDKYLTTIRAIQNDFNQIDEDNDVFRFIDEEGELRGIAGGFRAIQENVTIYDEYQNSVWGDILYGYTPSKDDYHKEFLSRLDIVDGKVVLRHNSDCKINGGYIVSKAQNAHTYTPQEDAGYTYFWGSKMDGPDQSGGDFTYYCLVDPQKIYDYSSNLENFKTQEEALKKYPFIGYYWQTSDAICVKSHNGAPISYIKYKGKMFNTNWEEI